MSELAASGATVLLTTQYLEEADRLADRIGVINEGRIISEGTVEELKSELGHGTVEVGVDPGDRDRAMQAMRRTFDGEVTWDSERNRLLVPAPEGSSSMVTVVRVLDGAGVTAEDLGIHKPTLDDVFLSLTGSSASTDEDDEEMQP